MVHFDKHIGPDLIKVCNDTTKANGIAQIQDLLAFPQEERGEAEEAELEAFETELGPAQQHWHPGLIQGIKSVQGWAASSPWPAAP